MSVELTVLISNTILRLTLSNSEINTEHATTPQVACFRRPPAPALKCCKHAINYVCVDSRASCAVTNKCAGLLALDSDPALARAGRFVSNGAQE